MQIKKERFIKSKLKIMLVALFVLFLGLYDVNAQACPSRSTYTDTQATLVGEITDTGGDQNIQVWFEWGRTTALTNTTPVQTLNVTYTPYRFCYTIFNLNPCTTYYYRAVAKNSAGINYGEIRSFTTTCGTQQSDLSVSCYSAPNPAYVGSLVTFYSNVSGGTGYYSYSWSGDCVGNSSICQKTFYTPGTYYVYLTVYSDGISRATNCSVNVISREIQQTTITSQNQKPIANITYSPTLIKPGTIVTFSSAGSYDPDGRIILYEWSINNEIVSRNPSFSRALSSGTYNIKLTVVDDKGATSSKELVLSVGRTQFITKTITKTITQTVRVPVTKPTTPAATLVTKEMQNSYLDISIDDYLKTYICKKDNINITIINNNSKKRKVSFTISGEIKKWFKPKARVIEVLPNDINSFNWTIDVPCDAEEGEYYGIITAGINGTKKDFPVTIEVSKKENIFAPLAAFAGGLFSIISTPWILVIILILLNIAMWYYLFARSKEKTKIE